MSLDRAALVAAAAESIARGSKSFALASKLFDRQTRERAWLLYFWCRTCDDIADGQDHGGEMSRVVDAQSNIATLRKETDLALAGKTTGNFAFDGLGLVVAETGIPHQYPRDLIAGFALDAVDWRPQTEADLMKYSYHVAGAVGCMMAIILGVDAKDDDTIQRACNLGLAFQLANIARDIAEDEAAGRCYIPADWLCEANMKAGELMQMENRKRLAAIGKKLAAMVEAHETSARIGARRLPFRSRWAVLSAAGIYGEIARKVAMLGESAWDRRIAVSKRAKLGWVAKAFFQAF